MGKVFLHVRASVLARVYVGQGLPKKNRSTILSVDGRICCNHLNRVVKWCYSTWFIQRYIHTECKIGTNQLRRGIVLRFRATDPKVLGHSQMPLAESG